MKASFYFESVGAVVVNTTPHAIRFQDLDGSIVEVPADPSMLLNAKAVEEAVADDLVTTRFVGTDEGRALIGRIQAEAGVEYPGAKVRIVGSIIAAQAYPGRVVGMTPAPGFERVAPAEKRMRPDKFTVFMP